jgi:DNA-binding NarL/FixJ family response regulator
MEQVMTKPLTERELQVCTLVAAGHNDAQIARKLQVSTRTVEKHVANACEKVGAHSRTQTIAVLLINHHLNVSSINFLVKSPYT